MQLSQEVQIFDADENRPVLGICVSCLSGELEEIAQMESKINRPTIFSGRTLAGAHSQIKFVHS